MTHRIAPLLLASLLTPTSILAADDLPALRKGMWEFHRTLAGQGAGGKDAQLDSKKCVDPWVNMNAMKQALAKQGCKATPGSMKGNVRTSVTECPMQGAMVRSETVMTIANDSAYTVNITTTGGGKTSKETLVAKRVGDC